LENRCSPEMKNLLVEMVGKGASDLHLVAGTAPQLRIDGKLMPADFRVLTPQDCQNLICSLLTREHVSTFEAEKELDVSLGLADIGRFRANVYRQRDSIAVAIRLIPSGIQSFEELGLPVEIVKNLASKEMGLIIISGAAGTGKSTTLAAMVKYINQIRRCHIVSIEDPIEYVHRHEKGIISQRELGQDTKSFSQALKHVLRQDPNVILLGEMRDLETIESALLIAETGHLVLATLHTGTSSDAISRIIDVFPAFQQPQVRTQTSLILLGVIVQQLLPRANDEGRVLAVEVMVATPAIQNLIRENKLEQIYSAIQTGSKYSMCTLSHSLSELYKRGEIGFDMALSMAPNPKEFLRLVENSKSHLVK